jgi:hypothetical protein
MIHSSILNLLTPLPSKTNEYPTIMNSPISVSDGLWTFTNYGPLTTTFTPVPSCTGPDARRLGNFNNGQVIINYAVQCTNNIGTDDNCWPAPTTTQSPFPTPPNGRYWEGIGGYYSPGLYCPKGWETVGVAARDAGSSLSSSGALSTTTVVETFSRSGTETGFFTEPTGDNAGSMLKGVLEPKQTMAVCCPRYDHISLPTRTIHIRPGYPLRS